MHQISNFLAKDCGLEFSDNVIYRAGNDSSRSTKILWIFRTLVGKSLSALRLFKALFTFENPLDYLVWKIERHTGIRETPTDLQRKYPYYFHGLCCGKFLNAAGFVDKIFQRAQQLLHQGFKKLIHTTEWQSNSGDLVFHFDNYLRKTSGTKRPWIDSHASRLCYDRTWRYNREALRSHREIRNNRR